MKINSFSDEIFVNFVHNIEARTTSCKIYIGDEHITSGHSNVCSNDTYNKREGRLLTLRRALYETDITGNLVSNGLLTKEERTAIWKHMLNHTNVSVFQKRRKRMVKEIKAQISNQLEEIMSKKTPFSINTLPSKHLISSSSVSRWMGNTNTQ